MIDKRVKSYIRTRYGDANFKYVEKFDSVEKAANPSNEGKLVEVVVNEIKWDHTKVKEDADGRHQESSAETDGQTKKEK
jgi:hypothetical protein|tara:strand:- start:122 stop:358 length:237 start_codon:yes stop_codon:yes gene_type:complete